MKNIYLVGFMATGKTSVGKALAKSFKKAFLDLDDLIEQKENMRIVDIFKQKGEPYFRGLESRLIKEMALRKDLVIGCGGGAIVNKENLANLKKSGIVICLKADAETILIRSQSTNKRPLLNVKDPKVRIKDLLKEREPFYNQVDFSIDTTDLTIREVVNEIKKIIENGN